MKKLGILLLCIFVLTGCVNSCEPGSSGGLDEKGKQYVAELLAYKARTKNRSEREDNAAFTAFLDEFFKDSLESDYMTQRFLVNDRSVFRLAKPELSLGEITFNDNEESLTEMEEELKRLREFDFRSLSFPQQIAYESVEYSYLESLATVALSKYDLLFTESGLISNIGTNFAEFVFNTPEDVDDYLVLLADVDRYLDEALAYTAKQAEEGIALQDASLEDTRRFIEEFTASREGNSLITSFNEKIQALEGLNAEAKETYISRNKELVLQEVLPAYEKVSTELMRWQGKSKLSADDAGVAGYNQDYAALMLMKKGNSNLSADDFFDEAFEALDYYIGYAQNLRDEDPAFQEYQKVNDMPESYPALALSAQGILDFNQKMMTDVYPDIGDAEYKVSELDPKSISSTVMAYFLHGTLDSTSGNVIRTNPAALGDDLLASFSTLSHEGIPGHMYQDIYFRKQNPHPYRQLIDFIGYAEGHAMMSELDALSWAGFENEKTSKLLGLDIVYGYILHTLVDIGVNVYGWDKQETKEFLDKLNNGEATDSLYEAVVSNLGSIMPYGLGLAQFINIRRQTQESVGDQFEMVRYNDILMKNGPLPFFMIREEMNHYQDYIK